MSDAITSWLVLALLGYFLVCGARLRLSIESRSYVFGQSVFGSRRDTSAAGRGHDAR